MSPLLLDVYLAGTSAVATWVLSRLTRDYSWVDRFWSIVPVVYVAVFALAAHLRDARLDVMAVLTILWGARLTFNLARKGGYSGMEDYRWAVLRSEMSPRRFQLFNLFFIAIYQNLLLLLLTLPAYTAYQHRGAVFGPWDVVVSVLFFACLVGETVADQQQWDFHLWKRQTAASGADPDPAFLQTGLFRFARHPNYFFEIAQWWVIFGFGSAAARSLGEWTVLGAVLLTLLFIGSTRFTERLSLAKYPSYANYQRRTSAVIPWWPRRAPVGGGDSIDTT